MDLKEDPHSPGRNAITINGGETQFVQAIDTSRLPKGTKLYHQSVAAGKTKGSAAGTIEIDFERIASDLNFMIFQCCILFMD